MAKTIIERENKQEVEVVFDFIKSLTADEMKEFKSFIDGVKFAKQLRKDNFKS